MQIGVIMSNRLQVALKDCMIGAVEADQRGVEANVSFGNMGAEEEGLM